MTTLERPSPDPRQKTTGARREPVAPRARARSLLILLPALLLLLLSACASAPTEKRTLLVSEIHASTQANPDSTGRASPVLVYVFSLRSLDRLQSANILELLDSPSGALVGDLVSFRKATVLPGEISVVELDVTKDTRYIAAVAALQDHRNQQWKDSVDISSKGLSGLFRSNKARIDVNEIGIQIHRQ